MIKVKHNNKLSEKKFPNKAATYQPRYIRPPHVTLMNLHLLLIVLYNYL